jgi:hypothetical protein
MQASFLDLRTAALPSAASVRPPSSPLIGSNDLADDEPIGLPVGNREPPFRFRALCPNRETAASGAPLMDGSVLLRRPPLPRARFFSRLLFAAVAAILLALHDAHAGDCLNYGPVELVGHLEQRIFAAPPNWTSVKDGDERVEVFVLTLPQPITFIDRTVAR